MFLEFLGKAHRVAKASDRIASAAPCFFVKNCKTLYQRSLGGRIKCHAHFGSSTNISKKRPKRSRKHVEFAIYLLSIYLAHLSSTYRSFGGHDHFKRIVKGLSFLSNTGKFFLIWIIFVWRATPSSFFSLLSIPRPSLQIFYSGAGFATKDCMLHVSFLLNPSENSVLVHPWFL